MSIPSTTVVQSSKFTISAPKNNGTLSMLIPATIPAKKPPLLSTTNPNKQTAPPPQVAKVGLSLFSDGQFFPTISLPFPLLKMAWAGTAPRTEERG